MPRLNWLLTLVGVLLAIAAWFFKSLSDEIVNHGVRTTGTVLRIEYSANRMKSGGNYFPVINFDTKDGGHITARSHIGSTDKNKDKVGEQVKVIYDEKNPESWSVDSWGDLWGLPTSMGILSAVMFFFAPERKKRDSIDSTSNSKEKLANQPTSPQ